MYSRAFYGSLTLVLFGMSSSSFAREIAYIPQNAAVVATRRLVLEANRQYLLKSYDPSEPLCSGFPGDGNPGPIFMWLNRPAKYIEAKVSPIPRNDVAIDAGTILNIVGVSVARDVPFPSVFRDGDCESFDFAAEALGTLTVETDDHTQIAVQGFFFNRSYDADVDGTDYMKLEFLDLDTDDLEAYLGFRISIPE